MIRLTTDRNLGMLLRDLRIGAGLTQTQLGIRTHLTKGGVSKREIDSRAVTAGALIDTAHALGYDVVLVARDTDRRTA
jgi:transcriptional regulator with XRE-family HTH domain